MLAAEWPAQWSLPVVSRAWPPGLPQEALWVSPQVRLLALWPERYRTQAVLPAWHPQVELAVWAESWVRAVYRSVRSTRHQR